MARGISIKDVENKVQHINDNNVIPLSTGADVPEVVTVGVLKEHINEDVETAIEGKQDVINDLATIRSGAALGATAVQEESDPTVPSWAKQPSKPSYSYSEITGKPTLSTVATSGSYNDLTNKPTIPTVPANVSAFTNDAGYLTEHQDISGKANSEDLSTVAFSGDYEDLTNTPTIPDVPEWAMSSTKPSYTVSEIDGAQEELVSGTNIKTINGTSILGSGNITIQGGGGGGDVNVIESITFNGSAVPVDSSKNAAITYSAPVTSVNGNTGAVTISVPTKVSDLTNDSGFITSETEPDFNGSAAATITSADITAWNGKSTFSGSYNDLTDKPTLFSGAYADLTGKPNFATVATSGDYDDLSNKPTIPSAVTETTVSGWGFTKNAGTVTSVTVNGSTYSPTNGDVDLGTIGGGTVYTAAWTASSSSSSTARLTDILSLTEGLYIVRIQLPITQNSMTVQLDGTNIVQRSNTYYNGPNYSVFMDFIEVSSGGGTLYVRSASNAAQSFSYLERGSLKALKLM